LTPVISPVPGWLITPPRALGSESKELLKTTVSFALILASVDGWLRPRAIYLLAAS